MDDPTEFGDRSYQFENIMAGISTELEELRQQFPGRFPKPVYVQAAVDDSVDGQWEHCLRLAKANRTGERVILIPYHLGNSHWIGILLEFNANEQIQRAEFIDPVTQSSFVPTKLQKQFAEVYPDVILRSRNLRKHDELEQSAALTVENLLKAAEEAQFTDVKCTGMNQTADDCNPSNCLIDEERSLSISAVPEGNNSKLRDLEQISSSEFERFKNQGASKLTVKVPQTELEIKQYEELDEYNDTEKEKEFSGELEKLQNVTEQIYNVTSGASNCEKDEESKPESCEMLKEQLEDSLAEHDINSKEELKQRRLKKQQEIQSLKNEGKNHLVREPQDSLSELEQLQLLVDQIEVIESSNANNDYEVLQKQLEDGLAEYDMSNKEELKSVILKKQQEIQSLEDEGKHNLVRKRKDSLSALEHLQMLVDQIEVIESSNANNDYEVLQKQLEDGLAEYDMSNKEELKSVILKKQQEIQSLEDEGKHNLVRKRKDSLSQLEQLQLLVDKIEAIKPSHPSVEYNQSEEQLNIDYPMNDTLGQIETTEIVETSVSMKEKECPITEESLRNMYKDFRSMPSCSERSIICLLFYVFLNLVGDAIVLDHSIEVPDQIELEMMKEFECLQERLKIEELESAEISDSVQAAVVNTRMKNWKCALTTLKQLFKQLHPLDMQELFRLVENVDDAARLIKNKSIILFLGGTGSGKSTTIHFLAGSKMEATQVQGMNHIAPTIMKNSDLLKITTSPFARSETRYITPVTVNFEDIGGYNTGSIILCDSPGFEDTSGPEVDIANGFGVVKAIKGCKSVKPVVLVSYKSIGDRCGGVKDLAHVLARLIPGIKDQIKAFSYLFTKYPQNERNTIHASLHDVYKKMNDIEKSDLSFVNIFKDMLHKTEDRSRAIDPINDKPSKILDELVESVAIEHPDEVFQFSITEKSKAAVQEQVRKHQLSIMSATKRSEYKFINYKLDQLQRLSQLLSQDSIEQIYNDCVRYISGHLSEEYEEYTTALNRCLTNQTVLSNVDIEQFQLSIDHAQLAGKLREKHLGKEVVHSSAFIQYLNQQVDIILENLREKNIDDLSVKISLDKIKLLANSFPNIVCKYKDACQFLAEQFDSVVNSFKSAVLSNQFDNCTTEITKFYEALTILQDHIDRENMEVKYVQLKEYFLQYLNDCVEKLNQIFIQEKLEKRDIDNLISCASMLEIASNTFALYPHISKESINEIYENFLSKIVNHFEEIIQKLHTELQNEYSFHSLEQLIKEMTLIRTISSIESRTNRSYYSTLEKLCGCIRETRREVEEILKASFLLDATIDYNKLTKCLFSLKKTRWIEEYRPEVYSNVADDVEKQLIQHAEKLQKSVLEMNLDLDNYDKIENVYKIVCEINKMKQVEIVVTDIGQRVDAVNIWFEREIENTCVIIKNTFSLQTWTEQGHQPLDLSKVEKALHYLDACKKIRVSVKSDYMSVLNGLEGFIRYFSNFVQKEMETCFETIKQYENENKKDMLQKVRIISNRLREITEIKTKHSCVFLYFSNQKIIEDWQNELSSYLVELSDEMGRLSFTQRTEPLNIKLSIAQALSKLDGFLEGEKYINVYNTYQHIFYSQTDDVGRQLMDAIKNSDYQAVASKMMAFQSSGEVGEHFFKQAKQALTIGLDNLMEETKNQAIMLGNNIEREGIKSIVENLKRMQRAKQFVSQFVDTLDQIEKCIVEVKKLIENQIKRFLERVEALININNFYEADQKIESITLVRTLLGNYCTEGVFEQIEALKERQAHVVLKDVVDKYSQMDITGYILSPPTDIFEKFGQVNNTNPIYNQALNTIKERIIAKFREELEKAKSKLPPDPENGHIRKFESAVKYLPEAMRSALEVELRHCKEDILLIIRDSDTKLKNAFDSRNLKNIKSILHEYKTSEGMQSFLNKGRELLLKQLQEVVMKINQNFEQCDIREALINMKELYDYKIELEDVFSEIKYPYFEVQSRIIKTFQGAYQCFMNRFLNANISTNTNETGEAVEKSFIYLIEFMKFTDKLNDQQVLPDIFPGDVNEKMNTLVGKILDYSTEHKRKYEDALEKLDIVSLINFLETTHKWNSLFTKIKTYEDMHSENDTLVNTIVKIEEMNAAKLEIHLFI